MDNPKVWSTATYIKKRPKNPIGNTWASRPGAFGQTHHLSTNESQKKGNNPV